MNAASMKTDAALLDEYQEVESSNLAGAGVRGDDLVIVFRSGAVYLYPLAGELLHPLLASESKGRFFNARVRTIPGYLRLCAADGCLEPVLPDAKHCALHREMTSGG